MGELRAMLFDEMVALHNGTTTLTQADATIKLARQIITKAKRELQAAKRRSSPQ
jgi:ribosomal protein L17